MEITFVKGQFKIKGKTGSVLIGDGKVNIESDNNFVVDSAGEFEVGGVSVIGLGGRAYVIELDGLRICTLENKLTDAQLSDAGAIDITVSQTGDMEVIKPIDPWVAVTTAKVSGVEGVAKYVITKDKLPTEFATVWLTS